MNTQHKIESFEDLFDFDCNIALLFNQTDISSYELTDYNGNFLGYSYSGLLSVSSWFCKQVYNLVKSGDQSSQLKFPSPQDLVDYLVWSKGLNIIV